MLQENNAKDDIRIDKNLCFMKMLSLVFHKQKNKLSSLFFLSNPIPDPSHDNSDVPPGISDEEY